MRVLRPAIVCACLTLCVGIAHGDVTDGIEALFHSGDFEEARQAIAQTLDPEGADSSDAARAEALRWLGRIEVAGKNWPAALAAYERLKSEFGETRIALDAATEWTLLKALEARPDSRDATAPRPEAEMPAAAASSPAPASPSRGGVLVGAYGQPFKSAEQTGLQVERHLQSNNIVTEFEATPSQALRGGDAVAAYLLTRTRELERPYLILVRSRWGHREFVEVECYDSAGLFQWKERVGGGSGLRDDKIKQPLMVRLFKKLEARIGGPGLETRAADQ